MKIDFSWSLEEWKSVFKQLLALISNFFAALGIKIFPDSPEYNPNWDELVSSTTEEPTDGAAPTA